MKFLAQTLIASIILCSGMAPGYAQTAAEDSLAAQPIASELAESGDRLSDNELEQADQRRLDAMDQLRDIKLSLQSKVAARSDLLTELKSASQNETEVLEAQVAEINSEIEMLEKTFEQIVIGGVDLSLFGIEDEPFDWREELITVVKPVIENVKSLTEKPGNN